MDPTTDRSPALRPAAGARRASVAVGLALTSGTTLGLLWFRGQQVPLLGTMSVGVLAAATTGVVGMWAFVMSYLDGVGARRFRDRPGPRRLVVDTLLLTAATVGVAILLIGGVFGVLHHAFREMRLEPVGAALLGAGAAAVACASISAVASSMTARALSALLILLATSGVLASMLSAPDPLWWQRNLSELGAGSDFSAVAFNATLIATGMAVTALSGYVETDLRNHPGPIAALSVRVVRTWLIAIGALLAGVGLVPVSAADTVHTVIASIMGVGFVALVAATPFLLPALPRWFHRASVAVVVAFGAAVLLMWPARYLNLTGVEVVGAGALMAWVVLLARATTPSTPIRDEGGAPRPDSRDAARQVPGIA
ncbi:DUF998 domain-containing protein [Pseudonocardia sp. ICBG1293]|uniref:DUF998 domain-containing protein n=1 Tax=Pseudonocardia sp. ICBG1293 TaxID=2844382 RepID=UPI001CCC8648|nr:DUF998 domain-containing protein [Pseudonocardia sp. ICBG1293]